MSYMNNRSGTQTRGSFNQAGGVILRLKHPYLSGQISESVAVDTIDFSNAVKLNSQYLRATPMMSASVQEVMVDGSAVTITNTVGAGSLTISATSTTGVVGTGDFIAATQLIRSVGDTVGGVIYVKENKNGLTLTTIYYGATPSVNDDKILEGNSVPTYSVVYNYQGWIQTSSKQADVNAKRIWAVANDTGIEAVFQQYGINNGQVGANPLGVANSGLPADTADDLLTENNLDMPAVDTVESLTGVQAGTVSQIVAP